MLFRRQKMRVFICPFLTIMNLPFHVIYKNNTTYAFRSNPTSSSNISSTMASQDSYSFHWQLSEFDGNDFQIPGQTLFFVIVLFPSFLQLPFFSFTLVGSASSAQRLLFQYTPLVPPPPQGLDSAFINDLPIILHTTSSGSNTVIECCIFLEIFQDGDKVKVIPSCQHSYHSECIDRWLRNQSSCPLCRVSLRFDLAL